MLPLEEKTMSAIDVPVAETGSTSKPEYLHSWRLAIVITSLFLGQLLMALDVNIINVAIPEISTHFAALNDVAWYGAAYLLTITAFQPSFGTVYCYFDIDVTYKVCIIIFEVGSVLCAAASSSEMFIVGRAIAGFGAAGVLQGALAVIGSVVELEKRPLYMGIVVSVFAVTVCVGPILGGVFTQRSTWRWCFWINLPIGGVVLALLFGFLSVPGARNENRTLPLKKKLQHLDPFGCLTFVSAVTCLLLALQWGGQTKPWESATIIGLLVGFVALISVFCYIQWRKKEEATIPIRVLFKRSIWTSALGLFCLGAVIYMLAFYIPFYFQTVRGETPISVGVRFIPLMLPQILALLVAGAIASQYGYYVPYIVLGEIICVVGLAMLTHLSPTTTTAMWAASLVITGVGMGTAMQLPYTAIQITLSEEDVPIGNAIAVFSNQLGGAIGVAMGQTIVLNTLVTEVPKAIPSLTGRLVMAAGATDLQRIAGSPAGELILRAIWNKAMVRTLYLSVAFASSAIPFALGMEWLNAKKVAEQRKAAVGTVKEKVGDQNDDSPTE
ncbi:MFS general substrate transporter [Lentithecium fluviatile CBS 122367]|uniref:MFS general substrate transporter n=1 Tax=Lentithecium fluviatile CBS 122367 TaxID=1168545 RepID=A0A6G1JFH6_9PLEO|nr:MFS general substrate transporter [Lentithecium fluviatile CBS 122367]